MPRGRTDGHDYRAKYIATLTDLHPNSSIHDKIDSNNNKNKKSNDDDEKENTNNETTTTANDDDDNNSNNNHKIIRIKQYKE